MFNNVNNIAINCLGKCITEEIFPASLNVFDETKETYIKIKHEKIDSRKIILA